MAEEDEIRKINLNEAGGGGGGKNKRRKRNEGERKKMFLPGYEENQENGSNNSSSLCLARILKIFTSPVSEEQAWAICHQCAKYFISLKNNSDYCYSSTDYSNNQTCPKSLSSSYEILVDYRIQSLHIEENGEIVILSPKQDDEEEEQEEEERRRGILNKKTYSQEYKTNSQNTDGHLKNSKIVKEKDVVQCLGIIVFQALDYGLSESEEHHLSTELESLIEYMTTPGSDDEANDEDSDSQTIDDEGIVNDDDDDDDDHKDGTSKSGCNFEWVLQMCTKHLSNQQDPQHHYRAVCRALFAEALELVTFLDKVSTGQKILEKQRQNHKEIERLEALERSDWARLWIQIMKQLRHGVKLKKVEHCAHSLQGEYELTPYEMLMKDIVFKRYTLNKIMVNGDIPPKIKHDAHAMILDFIRSRPPLHPMKNRVMKTLPPRSPDPHEKLLIEIRSQPKLRPIKQGKVLVETSRTKLNLDDDDESPLPVRKVIKPDFNLILDNSFEAEDDDSSSRNSTDDESRISSKRVVKRENSAERNAKLVRRHTIMVCESPTEAKVLNLPGCDSLQTLNEADEFLASLMGTNTNDTQDGKMSESDPHDNDDGSTPTTPTNTHHRRTSSSSTPIPPMNSTPNGHSKSSTKETKKSSNRMHVSWTAESSSLQSKEPQKRSTSGKECRPLSVFKHERHLFGKNFRYDFKCDVTYSPLYFSPEKTPKKKWQNPIECLSLTLDEVMHIRQVLTKAELESLITQPEIYDLVSRGKLCFSCKSVKFSLFSQWGNNCRFCKRAVCNKCIRKMHVPTEHFNKIPVYTLSPSPPVTPQDNTEVLSIFTSGDYVPSLLSPKKTVTKGQSPKRRPLQRAQTISEKPPESKVKELKGPLMNICCDCKCMVCEVIQASRLSISLVGGQQKFKTETNQNDPSIKQKNKPTAKVTFKTNSVDES